MYHQGRGLPQDYTKAVKWYRKAAERGNASAQNNLGVMYREGQGVAQDYAEAFFWFSLAAASASSYEHSRKARDSAAKKLSQNALIDAQKRAREWKPKPSWIRYRGWR
ncbi:MAG: sel1 repeat family protein [Micavibrio sp.]|nr:MAG: sel1 repeat family protein [Micavibrio sp.]